VEKIQKRKFFQKKIDRFLSTKYSTLHKIKKKVVLRIGSTSGNNCEYYHEVPLVICQKNIGKSDESYLEIKSKKNNTFFLFHVFLLNSMTNSDDLNSIINDFNGSKNRYIR